MAPGEVRREVAGEFQTEELALLRLVDATRRADDGLRGDAADVQAVAPHQVALDQGDPGAEAGGDQRRDQASGPRADHDQVIAALGHGVLPVRRVDIGNQGGVVGVSRCDGNGGHD
jgi:hypothetical protein